jgi:AcrR family transcriptional regulator
MIKDAADGNGLLKDSQAPAGKIVPPTPLPLSFERHSRGKGKRERTRARLIDATAQLIASGGAENATISEITMIAGLASGTFYNHFKDRSEIITETAICIMEHVAAQINRASEGEEDIALRLASGTRRFLDFACSHPTWAWAVLRAVDYLPDLRPRVYRYIGKTISIGYEKGQFTAKDDFVIYIVCSMLFAAVRVRLNGEINDDAGKRVAELQLRVLGVSAEHAAAAARAPIEDFDFHI